MINSEDRFVAPTDDIEVIRKSRRGLIVSPEVLERARARVAAGEDPATVAFDVATENVALQSALDNPGMDNAS
jgi:hypothetical protein